jgi:hypothetical protein
MTVFRTLRILHRQALCSNVQVIGPEALDGSGDLVERIGLVQLGSMTASLIPRIARMCAFTT